jgi:hypothetical protein
MDKQDYTVPLNLHPFYPKEKTLPHSGHLNWMMLKLQQKCGI